MAWILIHVIGLDVTINGQIGWYVARLVEKSSYNKSTYFCKAQDASLQKIYAIAKVNNNIKMQFFKHQSL